jgi:hypothetical protein
MVERNWEYHDREFARVTRRVKIAENGCWIWTGACGVQPRIHLKGPRRFYPVKRFAYEHFNQVELPLTHIVASRCKDAMCVRPSHHTAVLRGQQSHKRFGISNPPDYCRRGHEFSIWNTGTQRHGDDMARMCKACSRSTNRLSMRALRLANPTRDKTLRDQRRAAKHALVRSMKLACIECGESDPACLDFHHRDPSEKDATVAEAIAGQWSENRIMSEISKCDVVCANCHRKRHHSLRAEK